MSNVMISLPSEVHEKIPIDACDVVDALDSEQRRKSTLPPVPVVAEGEEEEAFEADADFQTFTGEAQTLEAETVAEARLAAAAAEAALVAADSPVTAAIPNDDDNNVNQNIPAAEADVSEASEKEGTMVESPQEADEAPTEDPRNRFVTPKDFELLKVIGMGAFGKVLQVKNRVSGQVLAMKVMSKRLLKRKSGYIENIQAEKNILKKVNHPFVVTMHCSFQTKEKLFIIMDYLAGGELFLRLGREGIFLEKDAAFYLGEIILGMDHLHSLGIIHR